MIASHPPHTSGNSIPPAARPSRLRQAGPTIGIWVVFGLVGVVLIFAPFWAYNWRRLPFPGFLVEQSSVITTGSADWSGVALGLTYPQRVIEVDGMPVMTGRKFNEQLAGTTVGQSISLQTEAPDGALRSYENISLSEFSDQDFARLFWLPYVIALFFLVVGGWVFEVRQISMAGRTFSYFCVNTALVIALLFDLSTSHVGTLIWTFALAQIGGAMIGLAASFPEEYSKQKFVRGIRLAAYAISMLLAGWGWIAVLNRQDPWAYVEPWRYSYLYTALGISIFVTTMAIRLRVHPSPVGREQIRIILWGSFLAFAPITFFLVGSSFKIPIVFNPLFFFTPLVLFPLAIGTAIVRYRLWDLDVIIRRTIVYTILTLTLVMLYLFLVVVIGQLIENLTGLGEFFSVLATFFIVVIFAPFRRGIQSMVDRRFYRQIIDFETKLETFNETLSVAVDLDEVSAALDRIVDETLQPQFAQLWIINESKPEATKEGTEEWITI